MDLKLWGVKLSDNGSMSIRKKGSSYIYNIIISNNNPLTYNVTLNLPYLETFLSFTDIQNKDFNGLDSFTRYIGSNEYYFIDGKLELRLNPRKFSFLEEDNNYYSSFSEFLLYLEAKYFFLFNIKDLSLIEAPKRKSSMNYLRKSRSKNVFFIETFTKSSNRNYTLTFENRPLLESQDLFVSVFKEMKKFFKTRKFGNNKSILAQTVFNGKTYSLHPNVKINNKTTPLDYWNLIKLSIELNYDKDYLIEVYPIIKLVVYNLDDKRNKNITIHSNISNLSIEKRWELIKNRYPSLNWRKFSTNITPLNKDKKINPFILFTRSLLSNISNITVSRIFVHDLDNSIFSYIHNQLLIKFDHNLIEVIQDKNNHYIYIKIFNLKFINSYRIFPVTEQELVLLFKGKDLYDALLNAQIYYYKKFNLDITSIVSTGSLAFKLFRINFLKKHNCIPILNKEQDSFIRNSYFGGAVHVFKHYARKVYHYDVNSLYPFAMLNPMPFKLIKIENKNIKNKKVIVYYYCLNK